MPPVAPLHASAAPSAGATEDRSGGAPLGVYVHFPWCLQKCPYCDFLSIPVLRDASGSATGDGLPGVASGAGDGPAGQRQTAPPEGERLPIPHGSYAATVRAELGARSRGLAGRRLTSVFFGGGTPSLWEPEALLSVLEALLQAFPGDAPEVTVECNPSSFEPGRARALRAGGVNRLSVGVQSLDPARLRHLGRLHDPATALAALEGARAAGFERVNADLIFGVAGQSAADAAREAATLVEHGARHVSAYALTVEPGTRFGELHRAGRLPLCPDDTVADSFLAIHDALGARGFEHYEVSNHAPPGEASRHNLGVWRGEEYLGLGVGAVGTVRADAWAPGRPPVERRRYRTTPALERYLTTVGTGAWEAADLAAEGPLVAQHELLDGPTLLSERVMLGLRLAEGLDVAAASAATGAEFWTPARTRAAERLEVRGLLVRRGPRLGVPPDRWLLSDQVIRQLM